MGDHLPTPEERRRQVASLISRCPEAERGLLRARLYAETPADRWDTVAGDCVKVRCAVCWKVRTRKHVHGEVNERPVATCQHRRCQRLWRDARAHESSKHEAAKAALLAGLQEPAPPTVRQVGSRASLMPLGALAVGATAAGLVLPRLSERQLQDAASAAFCTVVIAAFFAPFVRSHP
ncbi:hypothetical protein ACLEPN_32715 [Myxococcus sp. 1LA]